MSCPRTLLCTTLELSHQRHNGFWASHPVHCPSWSLIYKAHKCSFFAFYFCVFMAPQDVWLICRVHCTMWLKLRDRGINSKGLSLASIMNMQNAWLLRLLLAVRGVKGVSESAWQDMPASMSPLLCVSSTALIVTDPSVNDTSRNAKFHTCLGKFNKWMDTECIQTSI